MVTIAHLEAEKGRMSLHINYQFWLEYENIVKI